MAIEKMKLHFLQMEESRGKGEEVTAADGIEEKESREERSQKREWRLSE